MVRSIYTPEGRILFDDTVRRMQAETAFNRTVHQYLADFERVVGPKITTPDPVGV